MDPRLVVASVASLPLVIGLAVWLLKVEWAERASETLLEAADTKWKASAQRGRSFRRFLDTLFLAPYAYLGKRTSPIENRHLRAGLRVALFFYLTGALLLLLVFLLYATFLIIGLAIALALMFLVLWLALTIMSWSDGEFPSRTASSGPAGFLRAVAQGGRSRLRKGFFGDYVEHTDKAGKVVGRSQVRESLVGEYVEHTDAAGNRIGRTDHQVGFFGDYDEHRDADGRVVGQSRRREGFFGPYTEHTDGDGRVVGESREHEGFFGRETHHEPKE